MMDKIERIIDMTEHPERYSQDELQKMLIEDDEGSRIYKTISEVNAAFGMEKDVKMKQTSSKTASRFMQKVAAAIIGICLISGIAYAAVVIMKKPSAPEETEVVAPAAPKTESSTVADTPVSSSSSPIVKTYEDAPLSEIVSDIARVFSKQHAYRSDKAKTLRLYYRLDTRRGLEKNIEELNTFENINIEINGDTLVVD